jgi:hypothetical protein
MKINIEVDCTPDEARRFLGLPDVAPMQQTLMAEMERRLVEAVSAMDAHKLMEQWMPFGIKGMEQWQALWTQLAQAAASFPRPGGKKE